MYCCATGTACCLSPPEVGCFRLRPLPEAPNSGRPEFGLERGGVRGLRSRGWFPFTPALSPLGRGSPAVLGERPRPRYRSKPEHVQHRRVPLLPQLRRVDELAPRSLARPGNDGDVLLATGL